MRIVTIEELIEHAPQMNFGEHDFTSYLEFLRYFRNLQNITRHNLIIGANFTYAWMPTMFDFRNYDFDRAVDLLNQVKTDNPQLLTQEELAFLKSMINNSLVGTSKLLHFVNPDRYAVWDTRVLRYIESNWPSCRVERAGLYLEYLDQCRRLTNENRFEPEVRTVVVNNAGVDLTPLRVVELIMYENGRE